MLILFCVFIIISVIVSEEQCLQQITTDEMYPEIGLAKRANEAKEK